MVWLMALALLTVLLVAAVTLPRQSAPDTELGFPWFWVVFPATCFAIAASVGLLGTALPQDFQSTIYIAGYEPAPLALPNDRVDQILLRRRALWSLPILSVVGIGLSIWTWRRRHRHTNNATGSK